MLKRIQPGIGIALLAVLLTSIAVSAKGGFDFIRVNGPGLKEAVRLTDTALTAGFFSFANFYEDQAQPGLSLPPASLILLIGLGIAFALLFAYRLRGSFSH